MPPPIRAAFSVNQGTVRASSEAALAPRYASAPKSVQISRYAPTKTQGGTKARPPPCFSRWSRANVRFIGAVAGNIIATIMTTQIARNNTAPIPIVRPMLIVCAVLDSQISSAHDAAARISSSARKRTCPRCNCLCILHLPCGTPPHPDALSSWNRGSVVHEHEAAAARHPNVCVFHPRLCRGAEPLFQVLTERAFISERGDRLLPHASVALVLVVAAPPVRAGLVAPAWRAVEPLVHAPGGVQPARVRRVGVVDDAILECERAHAWPLSRVRLPIRSNPQLAPGVQGTLLAGRRPKVQFAKVVLDRSRQPLLLGVRRLEVVVEVATERRRPGEAPAHSLLVRLQF